MLNHIVMWKIKEDVADKEKIKLGIKNGLEGLFGKIEELKENKFHYIVYVSDEEINLNKVNKTIEIKNLEEAKMYNMDLENIFKDFELFLNKKITTLNIIRSYCSDSFNQHYGNDLITSFLNFNSIENNKELKGKMLSFFSEKTKEFDFDKEFKKLDKSVQKIIAKYIKNSQF